jgi:uncharacterized protein
VARDLILHPERITERPLVFEGTADLHDLPGLEGSVADDRVALRFKVTARLDRQRRKVVSCIIEGFVFLTCQATLDTFRHPLSIEERLVLVDDAERLPPIEEESDAEDYLVADEPIDVRELVEDAVILALPMVPRKPGPESVKAQGKAPAERSESPFSKLSSLKKPR